MTAESPRGRVLRGDNGGPSVDDLEANPCAEQAIRSPRCSLPWGLPGGERRNGKRWNWGL